MALARGVAIAEASTRAPPRPTGPVVRRVPQPGLARGGAGGIRGGDGRRRHEAKDASTTPGVPCARCGFASQARDKEPAGRPACRRTALRGTFAMRLQAERRKPGGCSIHRLSHTPASPSHARPPRDPQETPRLMNATQTSPPVDHDAATAAVRIDHATRRFGDDVAVDSISLDVASRVDPRHHRPVRGRQDDDRPDADGGPRAQRRRRSGSSARTRSTSAARPGSGSATCRSCSRSIRT